ncbi:MAG TPA: M23 family metallopeptidase, partial [Xanthobacteraceae bacterium]|nr:M23 family metallopeptidase [Xanthobacteraceae bacterium]
MGALAAGVAACSADTSRFSDPNSNPFAYNGNPFASHPNVPAEITGSLQTAPASQQLSQPAGQPVSQISAQPLPPPGAIPSATVASAGVSGGGPSLGMGSYNPAAAHAPPPPPAHDTTGAVAQLRAPKPHAAAASPAGGAHVHVIAPGETLMSLSRHYHVSLRQIASANSIPSSTRVKIGDRIVIPGHVAAVRPAQPSASPAAPKPPAHAQAPVAVASAPAAAGENTSSARIVTAGPQATAEAGGTDTPTFRWPVRGRVITGFGQKPNGQQSDGIDLAVPEGTAVRASEDGVVAYAGNELKGYGNLILIRHANGFVTAYAHASEILVKRNDAVRRG